MLTATNLIRCHSLYHLALAYYLLTAPIVLAEQNLVVILGAAMNMPAPSSSMSQPSPSNAIAALFLSMLAISDFAATANDKAVANAYWQGQTPIRLVILFALTAASYLLKPELHAENLSAWKFALGNSLVFAWAFVEMTCWFLIYNKVRDERRLLVGQMRATEEKDM